MRERGGWHALALILLTLVLIAALLIVEAGERKDSRKIADLRGRAAELELERDNLLAEINRGEQRCVAQCKGPATEQLLFLDLDERIYTQIYPLLKEREIPGVLGLDRDSLPGMPGKLSRESFDALLADGWEVCLVYQDTDSFGDWDDEITRLLSQANLQKPVVVYFPEGSFDADLEEELLQRGYTAAVHHGENGVSTLPAAADKPLWLPGAHSWRYNGVKGNLDRIVERGADHCFVLSFEEGQLVYEEENFLNMLELLDEYRENGSVVTTTFEEARAIQDPQRNGEAEIRAAWAQEKAALEERIHELDRQIGAIYDEWDED